MKSIFLDRDGVINKKMLKNNYVKSWNDFIFLPNTKEALRKLAVLDYKIIIITNQRAIAKKIITKKDLAFIHEQMVNKISDAGGRIDAIYYCPHGYNECNCRKPKPGLFLEAQKKFNINFNKSWLIGDSLTDIQAGQNLNIKTILLKKNYNQISITPPNYILHNLLEAAELIKNYDKK